ncbi:hypothetical protein LLG88_13425 [bacterium]|nr:hypothetical protein [bacterium]
MPRFTIPDYRFKFRVYPSSASGLFAKVYVFDTFRAMRDAIRHIDQALPAGRRWRTVDRRRLGGQVTRVTHADADGRILSGEFALIYLARPGLRMGIITHESVHAGLAWMLRRGVKMLPLTDDGKPHEEQLASVVDSIARQIVTRCDAEGLIPRG